MSRADEDGTRPEPVAGTFRTADGLRLHYRRWSSGESHAALAIAHGVAEHGGRYEWLATRLADRGLSVYALDHRGHGASPGPRVHIDRWHRYVDDFERFLARVAGDPPGRPVFALGHSMGALIALEAAIRRGESTPAPPGTALAGVVASAPPLRPTGLAKPHLIFIARVLSRVLPRVSLRLGIDPDALSRDPEVGRRYEDDPLVARRATVRWGTEVLRAVEWIEANASAIRIPLLILHGESDRMVTADGSRWLAREVGAELKLYPGGYHEPHNDLCRENVVRDIADWMAAITSRRSEEQEKEGP